jgi:hypothetical protein
LRGESEPLRRFGVLLSAAAVESKALELGLAKTTKEITDQDKVLARQALILEQTTDQQGDFARTADGAANKQRILAAEVENARAKIGEGLVPAYQQLLENLIPVAGWIGENASSMTKLGAAVAAVSAAIVVLNYTIKAIEITITVFTTLLAGLRLAFLTVAAATGSARAAQILAELTYKGSTAAVIAYTLAEKAKTAGTVLATAAQSALNFVMSANPIGIVIVAVGALAAAFAVLYDKSERFRDLLKSVWEWLKKVGGIIKDGVVGRIADVAGDIFRANGGPVRQGQSYIVGEQGPELFTASSSGNISPAGSFGGGQNINITINGAIDPEGTRRSIEKLLQSSARRTGPINLSGSAI